MSVAYEQHSHAIPDSGVEPRAKRLTPGRLVMRALVAEGLTRADLARALGVSESLITRWCCEAGRSMPTHRLEQLADASPRLYARMVSLLEARVSVRPSSCLRLSAMLGAAELGDVSRLTVEALADGEVDERERKALLAEWADVARVAAAAMAALGE